MALITTAGAADADSYILVADAGVRAASLVYGDAFAALVDSDEELAEKDLRQAAQYLQSRPYAGYRVTAIQALEWPRIDAIDPDYPERFFAETEIPHRIQYAQVEWAIFLQKLPADPTVPTPTEIYDEVQVGPIKVRSKGSGGATRSFSRVPSQAEFIAERLAPPPQVLRYLRPLFQTARGWQTFSRIS